MKGKDKKLVKGALTWVKMHQGWNCELISASVVSVGPDDVMTIFYKQLSENPDVKPCIRYEMFVNGDHKAGGVIR